MKKYKFVYEAEQNIKGARNDYVSESDTVLIDLADYADQDIKLVYEADGKIKASLSGMVEADDEIIITRAELEGIAE